MKIHHDYNNLSLVNPVVTLGIFDGVHRGHRTLINTLVARAKEYHGESVVITFSPHPRLVLQKDIETLSFLSTMEEKTRLLERAGVDHLIILEFTRKFSQLNACDFIKEILVKKLETKHLIIGHDHHFGRSGAGDFDTINDCASMFDFKVEQVQGLHTEEGAISSSLIRRALSAGQLDEANRWLGYSYSLTGKIVEGRKIGRIIGFPTANIESDYRFKLIPSDGVYAVEVKLKDTYMPGMLSIGSNPTVNSDTSKRSVEVNIFNFSENIYGEIITVVFKKRLRDEIKFENTEQLVNQMMLDKQKVLELFG